MRGRRWRRILLAVSGGVLAIAVALAGGVAWSVRRAADAGRLGRAQWTRLSAELADNLAAAAEETGQTDLPATDDAAAPAPARPARTAPDPGTLELQRAAYAADRPKTVIELQRSRRTTSLALDDPRGGEALLTLINLNPEVNVWYVLRDLRADGSQTDYHLANARPERQELELDPRHPEGVMLVEGGRARPCELLSEAAARTVAGAVRARLPYLALCDDALTLRLRTTGHRTAKEWATDFLRDNVWAGERITVFVRGTLFQDAYLTTAEASGDATRDPPAAAADEAGGPGPGRFETTAGDALLQPADLGIPPEGAEGDRMAVGRWYPARDNPGVFVGIAEAGLVAPEILAGYPGVAAPLDPVEAAALVYLVAFDLARFDVGFSLGTDHPRVGWSERVPAEVRDPALPGPDGIDGIEPLVSTGVIPAAEAPRTVAAFTGGFKRSHGAFHSGELASVHHGSHYGFVEQGVVLSKLQPGLSTIYALVDGRLEMKTWTAEDDAQLERVRFARQNGVPIVETDPATGAPRPGALVARWGAGNWSGSQDQRFRTLRAGACLQETPAARYLIYGYFSSATPSAMARVFQAYGCRHAMLLDMNALEHTYLAVYGVEDGRFAVQHLVRGMDVLDRTVEGTVLPRFLGFADNRDFFYLTRR